MGKVNTLTICELIATINPKAYHVTFHGTIRKQILP